MFLFSTFICQLVMTTLSEFPCAMGSVSSVLMGSV